MEVAEQALETLTGGREPRRVRVFALAVLGVPLVVGVVLGATGARLPSPGAVLLLALVIALCINRYALFPTEQAATAEAAVLLAAVVAFRHDALVLGPLVVALLVGPLDSLHWQQRSFLRMAYNAGNRGLATLAAVAGFVGVQELADGTTALVLGIAAAAVCFAAVDLAVSTSLLLVQGEARKAAFRHVLDIDALTLPVACYGAAAGLFASDPGWWTTALVLVPVAFAPELVLTRVRWRAAVVRNVALTLLAVVGVATLAIAGAIAEPLTLALLVVLGVLAGLEFEADSPGAVSPLLAVGVVAAVVVADGERAFLAAAVVAVVGAVTADVVSRVDGRRSLISLTTAVTGGWLAAVVYDAAPPWSSGVAWPGLAAGVLFALVTVMAAAGRRRIAMRAVWSLPVLGTAVACSFVWRIMGPFGGVLFVLVMALGCASVAWWGAPPWRSRFLSRWVVGRAPARHQVVLRITVGTAVSLLAIGWLIDPRDVRGVLVWIGIAVAETAVAMALTGVRQWRLAPHGRAREFISLVTVAGVLIVACPGPLIDGATWPLLLAGALLAPVLVIGARHARHASRVKDAIDAGAAR